MPAIFHFLISKLARTSGIIGTMAKNLLPLLWFPRKSLLLRPSQDKSPSLAFLLSPTDLRRWCPLSIWTLKNSRLPWGSGFAASITRKSCFMLLMIRCSWIAIKLACFKILRKVRWEEKSFSLREKISLRRPLIGQQFSWDGRSRHILRPSGFSSISKKLTYSWPHLLTKKWKFGMQLQANTWILFSKTITRPLLRH